MTAATASIQMDLAFVGGEGEWTKDLNCVLLVPLPVATVGRISSDQKLYYRATFSRTEGRRDGHCGATAMQRVCERERRGQIRPCVRLFELSFWEGVGKAAYYPLDQAGCLLMVPA